MATLIYRLDRVAQEEIEEVRDLLDAHRIDYYETPGGNWGVSVAGFWLRDEGQLDGVQALLDVYGRERAARVRAEPVPGIGQRLREAPVATLAYLAAAAAILYLSLLPFLA